MDRARASCILYSMPSSVNNRFMLNRSFSGRFPGAGGASMRAYLSAAVELKTPGEGAGGGRASDLEGFALELLREDSAVDDGAAASREVPEDGGPLLWNSSYLVFSLETGRAPFLIPFL